MAVRCIALSTICSRATRNNCNCRARAENASVSLDNRSLPLTSTEPTTPSLSFHVPRHDRAGILQAQFEIRQTALAAGSKLAAPLLPNISLLEGVWTVWLPKEFAAAPSDTRSVTEAFNWRRRLFGPLGRPSESLPFDPLRLIHREIVPAANDAAGEPVAPTWSGILTSTARAEANLLDEDGNVPALEGWQAFRTQFVAGGPPPLTIAYPSVTTTWAVAAFLACFVAGRAIARRQREVFVVLVAIAASAALLLPAVFAPPLQQERSWVCCCP